MRPPLSGDPEMAARRGRHSEKAFPRQVVSSLSCVRRWLETRMIRSGFTLAQIVARYMLVTTKAIAGMRFHVICQQFWVSRFCSGSDVPLQTLTMDFNRCICSVVAHRQIPSVHYLEIHEFADRATSGPRLYSRMWRKLSLRNSSLGISLTTSCWNTELSEQNG